MSAPIDSHPVPHSQPALPATTPARLNLIDLKYLEKADMMEAVAQDYAVAQLAKAGNRITTSLLIATGIKKLHDLLTPELLELVKTLRGTQIGFITDKDKDPPDKQYPDHILKQALVEAIMNGVGWTGNQFNVIAGKAYITLNGYRRKIDDIKEISGFEIHPQPPRNGIVDVQARWVQDGKEVKWARPIAPTAHSTTGTDALIGKATRKALKAIWEQITGNLAPADGDASEDGGGMVTVPAMQRTEQVRQLTQQQPPPPGPTVNPPIDEQQAEMLFEDFKTEIRTEGKFGKPDEVAALSAEEKKACLEKLNKVWHRVRKAKDQLGDKYTDLLLAEWKTCAKPFAPPKKPPTREPGWESE